MRLASLAALSAAYISSASAAFAGGCLHFIPFIGDALGGGSSNSGGVPAPEAGPILGVLVTAGVVALAHRRRRLAFSRPAS